MSHDQGRKGYYGRDRDSDRDWERRLSPEYRSSRDGGGRGIGRKRSRSRSLIRSDLGKRRSRTPRKNSKDIDDNFSKLPDSNELWDSNQFQDSGYPVAPPPPSFSREPSNQSYGSTYQPPYSGVYDDFPPLASAPQHPSDMGSWNQMALPPPPAPTYHNPEDQLKKEAAIESEMRHQKAALSKQREDYIKKSTILKKELDTLKDQRNELRGDSKRSPSPDTKRFLKENTKLQLEIQNKLKTINNVVDMLNGIIGEEAQELPESEESPERKRKSRSPSSHKKFNYVYYDPEMHWCRVCNEFPPTAKDYLNHLHSPSHHKLFARTAAPHMEAPWHSLTGVNEGFPSVPSAPTKRTPIRGLQFFVPSTAWYCKLCDQFIGDLHCASAHLKSVGHSKNYTNFVEQNPHWETDWMSDRQKAFEKARVGAVSISAAASAAASASASASASHKTKGEEHKPAPYTAHTITFSKDGFHTKRPKKSPSPHPDEKKKRKDKKKKTKKKKESSSSSSSSNESSDSESNKKKKKAKSKKARNVDATDDKALEEWMSTIQIERLNDSDRKLLDSLKARIKKERHEKQITTSRDMERVSEMQRKIRESERRRSRSRDTREEKRESREEKRDSREEKREGREEKRESRRDGERDRRDESRRDENRRDETRSRERWERRDKREETQEKKPEVKKMPFIGKMPVYKSLGKTKAEEQKKEDQKKKEEIDNTEKKKQEMDAEIQRKVLEFKEKIAKAQLERGRQQQMALPLPAMALPPPALALPATLGAVLPPPIVQPPRPAPPPPPPILQQQPTPAPAPAPVPGSAPGSGQPALPKDFQEALDIIFPSECKPRIDPVPQEVFSVMQKQPPPNIMNVPSGMGVPNYPPPMHSGAPMMQPPAMFGYDMNSSLFPQPQLYDSHVPIMPNQQNKQKQNKNNGNAKKAMNKPDFMKMSHGKLQAQKANGDAAAKKQEEMDDLAMLGIDASDVGAGI